eukprot:TRINITY_DN1930_c1_g1_i1.p2 TRINITY_DN1930_c1_g1~~TRINITY_DN1930_c1_g1_i1.p2  ORF type:complete len:212 (-),score=-13.98 TRINITY_DN1930_c1_g1_i1:1212-1847(-)
MFFCSLSFVIVLIYNQSLGPNVANSSFWGFARTSQQTNSKTRWRSHRQFPPAVIHHTTRDGNEVNAPLHPTFFFDGKKCQLCLPRQGMATLQATAQQIVKGFKFLNSLNFFFNSRLNDSFLSQYQLQAHVYCLRLILQFFGFDEQPRLLDEFYTSLHSNLAFTWAWLTQCRGYISCIVRTPQPCTIGHLTRTQAQSLQPSKSLYVYGASKA